MSPARKPAATTSATYSVGYGRGTAHMATRTAEVQAAFLLSHLKPGMRLLDCGCGPGTITLGLARRVHPGKVTGIDISESDIKQAKETARLEKVKNVAFQAGSVYELPFPDGSFDVVYSNGVFEHLKERERAALEVLRVLRPGGLAALRTPALNWCIWWPPTQPLKDFLDLWVKVGAQLGADFDVALRMPQLLEEAVFENLQLSASFTYDTHGGKVLAARMRDPEMTKLAVSNKIMTAARLKKVLDDVDAWAAQPGATVLSAWGEVLARKPKG